MRIQILALMALCALQPIFAMEQSLVPVLEENSIVHDFLYYHEKFKDLWGTHEANEITYSKLPKEIVQRIVREVLAPALAMLKKCPLLLTTTKKVSKTFFQDPMGYNSRKRWNYHAVHTVEENAVPKSYEAHPQSNLAFSALPSGTVKIWNMATRSCIHTLTAHTESVCNALIDPTGNLLATSSEDKTVKLWNMHSGECLHTFHEFWFRKPLIRFNKNSTLLAIADSNVIKFYDVATGKAVHSICEHGCSPIFHNIAFDDEETHFIGLHLDQADGRPYARLWHIQQERSVKLDTYYCEDLDVSDNSLLIKFSRKLVSLWDVGGYFEAIKYLDNLTLEQALLLNCLAHTMLINKTLRKKHCYKKPEFLENIMREFDFNQFPHLQPYFDSLPKEIQHGLGEYVILRDDEDNSWCAIA